MISLYQYLQFNNNFSVPPTEALPPEEVPPLNCMDQLKPMQFNHMKALVWKNLLGLVRNIG